MLADPIASTTAYQQSSMQPLSTSASMTNNVMNRVQAYATFTAQQCPSHISIDEKGEHVLV